MLYKKYHRNFVRKFKKGSKVKFELDKAEVELLAEPSIGEWREIFIRTEPFLDRLCMFVREWTLVFKDGRLSSELKLNYVHVIQEIS